MFPPFGWRNSRTGWFAHDREQHVISRALALRAQGYSLRATAAIMNDEGYESRNGGAIHPTQITRWERRSAEK